MCLEFSENRDLESTSVRDDLRLRVFQVIFQALTCYFSEYTMGAQATRLSDVKVKAAKPKEKDYILTDGNGLQMRVRMNGSKLWNFNYIHPVTKKRINMGLGTFPEVSLAQARKRTVEARELVAQGLAPKEKRDAERHAKKAATEHTFENISAAWFELKKDSVTPAYAEDIWRSLTLHVFPGFSATLASGPDGELIGDVGGCARSAQLGESLEHHVLAIRLKR